MKLDIGIGLTNDCNLDCSHCYSRENGIVNTLSFEEFKRLVDCVDVNSINFGTGESILYKDFIKIIEYLIVRNIKFSVTSNGYTVSKLPDDLLKQFNDIDISFDFPTTWENDLFRSSTSGSLALNALNKLKSIGVETSIATCMTSLNFNRMSDMINLAREFDVNLRVNIYKPVYKDSLALTYDSFWKGVEILLDSGLLISCSEPIVNTVLGTKILDGGCPCGKKSFRVTPTGHIVPCVYWKTTDCSIDQLANKGIEALWQSESFTKIRRIPEECLKCNYVDICKGGCAARRYYNELTKPDPYCYVIRNLPQPKLNWQYAESKDLVHASYLCTFIVK